MAVDVLRQDEHRTTLDAVEYPVDSTDNRLFPEFNDPDFPLLGGIDPCGDTVFGAAQIEPFLQEWRRLGDKAQTSSERDFLEAVSKLEEHCQNDSRLYLKFWGD